MSNIPYYSDQVWANTYSGAPDECSIHWPTKFSECDCLTSDDEGPSAMTKTSYWTTDEDGHFPIWVDSKGLPHPLSVTALSFDLGGRFEGDDARKALVDLIKQIPPKKLDEISAYEEYAAACDELDEISAYKKYAAACDAEGLVAHDIDMWRIHDRPEGPI